MLKCSKLNYFGHLSFCHLDLFRASDFEIRYLLSLSFYIFNRVFQAGFSKALQSQSAGVTAAAASSVLIRVVATVRQGIIDAEPCAGEDNLGLGHIYDRRMNVVSAFSFDSGSGGDVGGFLKRGYKLGATVGIAAIVGLINADKDVKRTQDLSPGKCAAQKYRVAGRDIG